MFRTNVIAVCLWLGLAGFHGTASAQSYLGARDLGSLRQGNQAEPARHPSTGLRGSAPVTDAASASEAINRAASERNGAQPGPSTQDVAATQRALDTRDLQHPRQTRTFDAIARPSRPD
ncbi:hypothetical protein [Pandoraea sputorum]|uniref:DUF4148 domain-containing protein n=1 Tax=Pandoraea sputorum TaxID=93222 RepID=A0A5E5BJW0_9BURK|nr:hypothetical protein [Pandoraea sputorum]VVE85577.1 hypothetical protein PSP31121_05310 [Pandoraea sputorum]